MKKYLKTEQMICSKKFAILQEYIETLTDYHANGSYEILNQNVKLLDKKNYAYMVRTVDLEHENHEENLIYVDEHAYNFLKKTKMYGNEIIINKIGSAGKVYIMPKLNIPVTLGMNQFMIRTNCRISEEYIYTFLNCKYGRNLIERRISGAVPPSIDKESVRNIKIPIFTKLEAIIKNNVNESSKLKQISKIIYRQAKNILLENVKAIDNDSENTLNINIKTKSKSFDTIGRLDAEYYQKKYDILFEKLDTINSDKLGNIVTIRKSIEPGSSYYRKQGIPFIRVSNLFIDRITEPEIYLDTNDIKGLESYFLKKDTILFSKDGSVGIAYNMKEDTKAITSSAILHLQIKNTKVILPEYLTLVLNSDIVKLQAERDSNGAIIQHWKPSEIDNVIIPILNQDIQKSISDKVKKSFELLKTSNQLIDKTKKAVEIAIEKYEEEAIKYINSNNKDDID